MDYTNVNLINQIFKNHFNLKNMTTDNTEEIKLPKTNPVEEAALNSFHGNRLSGKYDFLNPSEECKKIFLFAYYCGYGDAIDESIEMNKKIFGERNPVLDRGADNPDNK